LKTSIITAVFNNKLYIDSCIESVLGQTHQGIEHIIIDGGSTDGTTDVIRKYEGRVSKWISEPDNGIYDAMNKGIKLASGDIIGFLHADDIYAHERVIETVVTQMTKRNVDSCYGDLMYVDKENLDKVIRYWKSRPYDRGLFRKGWMPPHPTFFVRKMTYDKYGCFNTDFKIAADYELMLRFLEKQKVSTYYVPEVLIKMRVGGASNRSVINMMRKSSEDYRAMKMHDAGGLATLLRKNLSKIPQFFKG
jgi:glycosyltransferase